VHERSTTDHLVATERPESKRFDVGALIREQRFGFGFDPIAVSESDDCVEPCDSRGKSKTSTDHEKSRLFRPR